MRTGKVKIYVLTVMVIVFGVVQAGCSKKKQYSLKLKKGQKHYVHTTTDQKITQTIMGQEQQMEQSVGMGADFDVNDVDSSGNAWVRYTYRWLKLNTKTPMGETAYDSSKEDMAVPPMAQGFAALLGEGFSLKVTPEGKVEEIKDLDKMRDGVRKKLSGDPSQEATMKTLEKYMSEEAIKESIEVSMAIYPDKPVGIGDSWSKTFTLSSSSAMILESTWTLKERKNDMATIEVVSTVKPNPEAKPMEMGTMKMEYRLSGTQQGMIQMQESTGRIMATKRTEELAGEVTATSAASPDAQGITIPMTIDSTVGIEMTERKE